MRRSTFRAWLAIGATCSISALGYAQKTPDPVSPDTPRLQPKPKPVQPPSTTPGPRNQQRECEDAGGDWTGTSCDTQKRDRRLRRKQCEASGRVWNDNTNSCDELPSRTAPATSATPPPAGLAPAGNACSKDSECKGDRICVNGTCADPQAKPGATAVVTPYGLPPVVAANAAAAPAAAPNEAGTVPVSFDGVSGYLIRAKTSGGAEVSCTAPCSMRLVPGAAEIDVGGKFTLPVTVPNQPTRATIAFKKKGLLITGVVMGACGALVALGGYSMTQGSGTNSASASGTLSSSDSSGSADGTSDSFNKAVGWSFVSLGVLGLAVGVGLMIPGLVSQNRVTLVAENPPAGAFQPSLSSLRVGVAPHRDGGMFAASIAF
jgi:hypothetical protein